MARKIHTMRLDTKVFQRMFTGVQKFIVCGGSISDFQIDDIVQLIEVKKDKMTGLSDTVRIKYIHALTEDNCIFNW